MTVEEIKKEVERNISEFGKIADRKTKIIKELSELNKKEEDNKLEFNQLIQSLRNMQN